MEVIDINRLDYDDMLQQLSCLEPGHSIELVGTRAIVGLLKRLLQDQPLRYELSTIRRRPDEWRVKVIVFGEEEPRSVTSYLGRDHDRLDDLLQQAVKLAAHGEWAETQSLIADFRDGLFWHIEIEERLLFPEFELLSGSSAGGPTEAMRSEHDTIKECVNGLVEAAGAEDHDELARHHADLLGVLVEHNMKEESILYPETDRALNGSARNLLVEQMMLGV